MEFYTCLCRIRFFICFVKGDSEKHNGLFCLYPGLAPLGLFCYNEEKRKGTSLMHTLRRFTAVFLCLALALTLCAGALDYSGSASYASGPYYTALTALTRTGDARADIVAIAQSQVGYQEGGSASQLSGEVSGSGNYTEYGRWYGLQDMWCAMFVSWCAYMAEVPSTVVPKHSFTVSGLNQFIAWGRAYTRAEVAAGVYTPEAGDIIYFKSSRNTNKTNHVGIVTSYSGSTVYTVEGNTSSAAISTNGGAVCEKSYSITNTFVVYICRPNYGGEEPPAPSGIWFPACDASCTTIIEGLASIGVDSSYANRKRIAAANGFTDYSGTAAQNTQMLDLLKAGRLIDPDGEAQPPQSVYYPSCSASCATIVEGLSSIGVDSSYANRKRIAAANDVADYSGTAAQNTQMLDLLKAGRLINPDAAPRADDTYFPACAESITTLALALESVGADSSYSFRVQIAAANGVDNYSGTVDQNNALLALLKTGKLKKPTAQQTPTVTYFTACESSYTSLADALRSVGADGSFAYRAQIAAANGISDYSGTAAQNTELLDLLKAGRLVVPDAGTASGACGCGDRYLEHVTLAETCTENGAEYDRCTKCGAESNRVVRPATGHSYSPSETPPTCTQSGTKTFTCSCGDSFAETVPAFGHDFDEAAATVVKGVRTVICKRCGAVETTVLYFPGDVSANGKTDLLDVTLLSRALAGGWGVTIDEAAADVNRDGMVDLRDVVLLRRSLAGWDVELE